MKRILIYTDGACRGNPGPGGWAAILVLPGANFRREIGGGFRKTTNNRMEILAAIEGLEALREPCEAEVYTDSRYLCDAVQKGWVRAWQRRGWRKADNKPALNVDLWRRLLPLLETHRVMFRWLKGHDGQPENERCDALAREAASGRDLPADEAYEAGARSGGDSA